MISFRARLIRFISKQMFKHVTPDSDVRRVRQSFHKAEARKRLAQGVRPVEETIAGIDCCWLVPTGCENAPVIYYLHGGAYVMGSPATHRRMVSHIARSAGMRALVPDYALAPELPFPAGLNDCVAVYRALVESGIRPATMAIGGDSAGGGMTMATLLALRDAGDELPHATLLLSPWLDLTASGESARSRAGKDPWFRPAEMNAVARMYLPEGDLRNPLVSPVFAEMHGLPAIYVQVGDLEILLSDATRLRDRIEQSGGEIRLDVWPHMWHVFQFFVGQMPESRHAIDDIGAYLRLRFGAIGAA